MNKQLNKVHSLMNRMGMVNEVRLITEVISPIDLYNKLQKKGIDISEETFKYVLSIDPFTQGNKVGKLANWFFTLKGLYYNDYDMELLKEPFQKYYILSQRKKLSNELNNLQNIKTDKLFFDLLRDIDLDDDSVKSGRDKEKSAKTEATKFYEDGEWLVIIPKSEVASCYYGKGTKWCTAGKNDNKFSDYNERGNLYIIYNKKDKNKYQLHLEDEELMNAENDPVSIGELGLPLELISRLPENNMITMFDNILVEISTNHGVVKITTEDDVYTLEQSGIGILKNSYDDIVDFIYYADVLPQRVRTHVINNCQLRGEAIFELEAEGCFDYVDDNEGLRYIAYINTDSDYHSIIRINIYTGEYEIVDNWGDIDDDGYIFNAEFIAEDIKNYFLEVNEYITEQATNLYFDDSQDKWYYVTEDNKLYYCDEDNTFHSELNYNIDVNDVPREFIELLEKYK